MARTYTREGDGADMVEVKPHQFVTVAMAEQLGLKPYQRRAPAPRKAPAKKAHKRELAPA